MNVVTGPGGTVGSAIAAHPGVGKIAFTGETTTGQEIMRLAAGNIKRISLELGGKSPNICFADADIERFAAESPMAVFDNAGQDCCARSRILVERSVHDQVLELFTKATQALVVGDPADEKTQVGSLVSQRHRERVQDFIDAGQVEGAELIYGGRPPEDPALADGAFLMPTIFDACQRRTCASCARRSSGRSSGSSRSTPRKRQSAWRTPRRTDSPDLSGRATSLVHCALRRASARAPVSINTNQEVHTEAPFGGYKMSGVGRELGMHALDLYTEIKNVFIDLS